MLRIAICDDAPLQRKALTEMVRRTLDSRNIEYSLFEFSCGEELLRSSECYDIYLLDIRMEKLSGIETARKIRQTNVKAGIIFVTALKEYVFDAFDVRAFHYILKPVQEESLRDILISLLAQIDMKEGFILVKAMNQSMKVLQKDILYIEAQLRKVILHTQDAVIEYYHKLSVLEREMDGHFFFRCHRSYLVNLSHVLSYDSSRITLRNLENIPLSKYKYDAFTKKFMYYMKNGGY